MKLINEIMTLCKSLPITTNNYPDSIEDDIQEAVQYKRSGNYDRSLEVYLDILKQQRILFTGVLNGLFKTIAVKGYLKEAYTLLLKGNAAMSQSKTMNNPFGMSNGFKDHMNRMEEAVKSERMLLQYLTSISGNPYYKLARSYQEIYQEFKENI